MRIIYTYFEMSERERERGREATPIVHTHIYLHKRGKTGDGDGCFCFQGETKRFKRESVSQPFCLSVCQSVCLSAGYQVSGALSLEKDFGNSFFLSFPPLTN